jgi:hypothetical protein
MEYRTVARQRPQNNETTAIAGQQLEPLLGSGARTTMEVLLEAVFSMWFAPSLYLSTD